MRSSDITAALKYTIEDQETTMRLRNIVDKFLDQHCLADTGTAEKATLASTSIGSEEVYDFDTSLKNFGSH
jgi:hypothetical protein